jgi:hypothetical protein
MLESDVPDEILKIMEAVPSGPYRVTRDCHGLACDPITAALSGIQSMVLGAGEIYFVRDYVLTRREAGSDGKPKFIYEVVLFPFWAINSIKYAAVDWFLGEMPLLVLASDREIAEERKRGPRRYTEPGTRLD